MTGKIGASSSFTLRKTTAVPKVTSSLSTGGPGGKARCGNIRLLYEVIIQSTHPKHHHSNHYQAMRIIRLTHESKSHVPMILLVKMFEVLHLCLPSAHHAKSLSGRLKIEITYPIGGAVKPSTSPVLAPLSRRRVVVRFTPALPWPISAVTAWKFLT